MIPRHAFGSTPPQGDAVGHGAIPVGHPEGQQPTALALRNQLETIIGDLRIAYARLGQLPPEAIERDTFASLAAQYAELMDIAGQLTARLNDKGDVLGEDLGLAKDINTLQGSVETYIGAVESSLMVMMQSVGPNGGPNGQRWQVDIEEGQIIDNGNGGNGNGNGAQLAPAQPRGFMRWGWILGGLLVLGGVGYYVYTQRGGRVTPAF